VAKGFSKEGKHQALADIYDSLEELRYYRRTVFNI
jgi:oligoribonuclease